MNLTQQLAEALLNMTRALDLQHPGTDYKPGHWREPYDAAQTALAAYEASERAATDTPAGEHTRGPWAVKRGGTAYYPCGLVDGNGAEILAVHSWDKKGQAALPRIVACVNACEGIANPSRLVPAFLALSNYVGGHDENPSHPCRVASDLLANVSTLEGMK